MQSVQRGLKVSVKPKLLISWRCGGGGHGQRGATLRLTLPQLARTQEEGGQGGTDPTYYCTVLGGPSTVVPVYTVL